LSKTDKFEVIYMVLKETTVPITISSV